MISIIRHNYTFVTLLC